MKVREASCECRVCHHILHAMKVPCINLTLNYLAASAKLEASSSEMHVDCAFQAKQACETRTTFHVQILQSPFTVFTYLRGTTSSVCWPESGPAPAGTLLPGCTLLPTTALQHAIDLLFKIQRLYLDFKNVIVWHVSGSNSVAIKAFATHVEKITALGKHWPRASLVAQSRCLDGWLQEQWNEGQQLSQFGEELFSSQTTLSPGQYEKYIVRQWKLKQHWRGDNINITQKWLSSSETSVWLFFLQAKPKAILWILGFSPRRKSTLSDISKCISWGPARPQDPCQLF